MGLFERGEIVVIPFPFSDLSESKLRPALIISELLNDDYIMFQITSKSYSDLFTYRIMNSAIENGYLKFESYVKYSKVFTANSAIISKSIGKLKSEELKKIIEKFVKLLEI